MPDPAAARGGGGEEPRGQRRPVEGIEHRHGAAFQQRRPHRRQVSVRLHQHPPPDAAGHPHGLPQVAEAAPAARGAGERDRVGRRGRRGPFPAGADAELVQQLGEHRREPGVDAREPHGIRRGAGEGGPHAVGDPLLAQEYVREQLALVQPAERHAVDGQRGPCRGPPALERPQRALVHGLAGVLPEPVVEEHAGLQAGRVRRGRLEYQVLTRGQRAGVGRGGASPDPDVALPARQGVRHSRTPAPARRRRRPTWGLGWLGRRALPQALQCVGDVGRPAHDAHVRWVALSELSVPGDVAQHHGAALGQRLDHGQALHLGRAQVDERLGAVLQGGDRPGIAHLPEPRSAGLLHGPLPGGELLGRPGVSPGDHERGPAGQHARGLGDPLAGGDGTEAERERPSGTPGGRAPGVTGSAPLPITSVVAASAPNEPVSRPRSYSVPAITALACSSSSRRIRPEETIPGSRAEALSPTSLSPGLTTTIGVTTSGTRFRVQWVSRCQMSGSLPKAWSTSKGRGSASRSTWTTRCPRRSARPRCARPGAPARRRRATAGIPPSRPMVSVTARPTRRR